MSAVSAPFGLRPAYHPTGMDRAREYTIAASYATPIYTFTPVALVSNQINVATAGSDFLGSFFGVTYFDSTGKPTKSNFWPGATTLQAGTVAQAWVVDDPNTVFSIQSLGSIASGNVGRQINLDSVSVASGSTSTGLSSAMCTATLIAAASQGDLQIVDVDQSPANAWGDAFTVIQVRIARHQFVSDKVSV